MVETPATPAELSRRLVAWALDEGFDRAGVVRLEPSRQIDAFERWLERGDHAGMEWIARRTELRRDPRGLWPGLRSALCVALQYHPLVGEDEPAADDALWSRVARYARGRDYHEVMTKRLRRLEQRIVAAFPGAAARWYVDTGPILEREMAARAGLGVQAKNTHLLHRVHGSYFLLGELLLTLDAAPLRADEVEGAADPATDLCGRCTRCLDHCPTDALRAPYRLDANRCISYWTIEHRGDLPEAAREMVGEWVFGCDICQEVCPYNVKVPAADHPELRLPPERRALDLVGLLRLGRDEYVERFRKSPMKRAKLEGLRRNAAVALGHRGDTAAVGALAATLDDASAVVARHAAWALGEVGGAEARSALSARRADPMLEPSLGVEIDRALARIDAANWPAAY
ncbi:MAG: tRNA epoxyqueuosine(34) reductase QueG [Acidobacteriota bacterium]